MQNWEFQKKKNNNNNNNKQKNKNKQTNKQTKNTNTNKQIKTKQYKNKNADPYFPIFLVGRKRQTSIFLFGLINQTPPYCCKFNVLYLKRKTQWIEC